jgi:hypothetical protein
VGILFQIIMETEYRERGNKMTAQGIMNDSATSAIKTNKEILQLDFYLENTSKNERRMEKNNIRARHHKG